MVYFSNILLSYSYQRCIQKTCAAWEYCVCTLCEKGLMLCTHGAGWGKEKDMDTITI